MAVPVAAKEAVEGEPKGAMIVSNAGSQGPDAEMCEECRNLVGAGRRAGPHGRLVLTSERRVPSIMGAADEAYYRCASCGHEWLHETGSCGLGWVK